jgi:mannosyltransferase
VRRVWLGPSLLMAVLSIWRIETPQLWQDELVTVDIATRSFRQVTSLPRTVDAVHGTYYLFMYCWVHLFGDSEAALRSPSAIAMIVTAGCVALIGRRLFGHAAGLLGGCVFALVPSMARFGQEARSYAPLILAATLATLMLLRAAERPTWRRWGCYSLCVTAVTLMSPVAFTIVFGHGAAVLAWSGDAWRWRGRWWPGRPGLMLRLILAVLVGVLPALPIVNLGLRQASHQVTWIGSGPLWDIWPNTFNSTNLAWTVTALAALAWARNWRGAAVGTAIATVPLLVIWLGSLGEVDYFFGKYLMFVIPIWSVLAGAGLALLHVASRHALAAGCTASGTRWGSRSSPRSRWPRSPAWR